jgi:hypothetical protein
MTITDGQGRTRSRELTILRRDEKDVGEQLFYVHFHSPADVAKTTFIIHKHLDRDDDRWLYLPALDLEKQIAASDKRTSFVGSDFTYEDVSGRHITEDSHVLVETTDNYYVLENTPKDPGSVEFASFKLYVHKTTFLPVRADYVDANGKKIRTMSVDKVETIQGHPTVMQATMSDLQTGSKTVLAYSQVKYDLALPDLIFSKRYLRRAPVKYMND